MKKQFLDIHNQQKNPAPVNRWFVQRHDFFVRNVFKEFYKSYSDFTAIYKEYLESGLISFDQIEQLVGAGEDRGLWRLKDHCHQLWRAARLEFGPRNDFFLDWLIGSIFHEAMKLKENIYIISRYVPQVRDEIKGLHETHGGIGSPGEWQRFLSSANQEIPKQAENLAFLFGRAVYLLRAEVISQGENVLLLRYFFENPHVVKELWSESLSEIFTDLFSGRPEQGYCLVGKSYLDGHWHQQALAAYSAALELNGKCDDAIRRISQVRLILRHTANAFQQAAFRENTPRSCENTG